jgi:hypothetical protein
MIKELKELKENKMKELYELRIYSTENNKNLNQKLNNEITALNIVISILKDENKNESQKEQ